MNKTYRLIPSPVQDCFDLSKWDWQESFSRIRGCDMSLSIVESGCGQTVDFRCHYFFRESGPLPWSPYGAPLVIFNFTEDHVEMILGSEEGPSKVFDRSQFRLQTVYHPFLSSWALQ